MLQPQTAISLLSLIDLRGGTFLMGSDAHRPDERPAHWVRLGPFRAAARPVSNEEYRAYLVATGAPPPPFWEKPPFTDLRQPVVGVSWFNAVAYCQWLARETGIPFRLPTEAEREYAARGGISGAPWPWGEGHPTSISALRRVGRREAPHVPAPVCRNGVGLLCMGENVHEWCSDWYAASYDVRAHVENPTGPARGTRRASRGGSWRHRVKFTRVSARSSLDPSFRYNDYGFRVYADGP